MDTITQGLLGAVTAQCGFRRKIGRDAGWAAFAAAILPDGDIFFSRIAHWFGHSQSMDGLRFHRGFTHSLVMIPVLALGFTMVWWALRRWWLGRRPSRQHAPPVGFGWLYLCSFVALATHGLLDMCTSYGTQLLWPFSTTRMAWDCVPIVDLIYTPLLMGTLLGCYVVRKIWRKHPQRAARISLAVGIIGMTLSTAYLVAGRVCHDIARYRGMETVGDRQIDSAEAYPMLGSIFLWRVVIQTPNDWYVQRVHLFGDKFSPKFSNKDCIETTRIPKRIYASPQFQQAEQTEAYSLFRWFARGQLRPEQRNEDGYVIVEFHDMRYGWRTASPEGLWSLRFIFVGDRILQAGITHPRSAPKRKQAIKEFWHELWNP